MLIKVPILKPCPKCESNSGFIVAEPKLIHNASLRCWQCVLQAEKCACAPAFSSAFKKRI